MGRPFDKIDEIDDRRAIVYDLHEQGLTVKEIAAEIGGSCTDKMVYHDIYYMNLRPNLSEGKKYHISEELAEQMRKMLENGETYRAVAEKTGYGFRAVVRRFPGYSMPPRKRNNYRKTRPSNIQ